MFLSIPVYRRIIPASHERSRRRNQAGNKIWGLGITAIRDVALVGPTISTSVQKLVIILLPHL